MNNKRLLIIAHCPSPNTVNMANAILEGADSITANTLECELKSPFETQASDVLNASALILFTTENFGYMSGALKDFFERIYYPCRERPMLNEAKPFALVIKAGLDGTGTDIAVHKIIKGLQWKEVHPTLLCKGDFNNVFLEQCHVLGQTMAASLDADII